MMKSGLPSKRLTKAKKTQEKAGAQRSWSRAVLATTALVEVGSLGKTLRSSVVYQWWPEVFFFFFAEGVEREIFRDFIVSDDELFESERERERER